jgi:hypothetical protein
VRRRRLSPERGGSWCGSGAYSRRRRRALLGRHRSHAFRRGGAAEVLLDLVVRSCHSRVLTSVVWPPRCRARCGFRAQQADADGADPEASGGHPSHWCGACAARGRCPLAPRPVNPVERALTDAERPPRLLPLLLCAHCLPHSCSAQCRRLGGRHGADAVYRGARGYGENSRGWRRQAENQR